ncbi:hypothetical protein MML48_6g00002561 [Holotrichia oblita]|uniref:Uncharacterized protein n=1 Tax=Holotrichia oblita TaxID=644536 RepID=A0ACB9SXQ8_HOLOL|nr:hypothetical protein MML48_6g00002561 [Holotrichia oblita]
MNESDMANFLKNINLFDAVYLLHNAWEKVSTTILEKCWKHLKECFNGNYEAEDLIPLSVLCMQLRERTEIYNDVSSMLGKIPNEHSFTKEDIRQWIEETEDRYVRDENVVNEANEDEEEDAQDKTSAKIKHCQVVNCITTVIQWAEENNIDLTSILSLKKIREEATVKLHTKEKCQSKLTDFLRST